MPDLGTQPTVAGAASSDDFLLRQHSDGDLVRLDAQNVLAGAPFGGAGVAAAWLKLEHWVFTSITRNSNGVITSGNVKWSDGSTGVFTATSIDATTGGINAYTVTHADSGKTVTQPAITRDASGQVQTIPDKTVA